MERGELDERLARVRQLIREIHHVALATVNADGSPHLSPVLAAIDDQLRVYWQSHPESQHSHNIARTGQVFITLFDSREGHGGLYIQATAGALTTEADIEAADKLQDRAKKDLKGGEDPPGTYPDDKNYRAVPAKIWINKSDRSTEGITLRDRRHEITLKDLLAP